MKEAKEKAIELPKDYINVYCPNCKLNSKFSVYAYRNRTDVLFMKCSYCNRINKYKTRVKAVKKIKEQQKEIEELKKENKKLLLTIVKKNRETNQKVK